MTVPQFLTAVGDAPFHYQLFNLNWLYMAFINLEDHLGNVRIGYRRKRSKRRLDKTLSKGDQRIDNNRKGIRALLGSSF